MRTTFFERRALMMQDWTDFFDRPVAANQANKVVPICVKTVAVE